MVILDKIENLKFYPALKKVQDFLAQNPDLSPADGKVKIDDDAFVFATEYQTKTEKGLFEGHEKYLDVQVMLAGEEYVFVQDKRDCVLAKPYDEVKDKAMYSAEKWHSYYFAAGSFILLDEADLHRPSMAVGESSFVRKYVFKVRR